MKDFYMPFLRCPVCGSAMLQIGGSLLCYNRHTYDIARQGYVNLLPVQQKHSLFPGDTPDMLAARRLFLNEGHYAPIASDVIAALASHLPAEGMPLSILDAGCGEGYYTAEIAREFPTAHVIGADIAKAAVKMASSRSRSIDWIVATASHLPVADGSMDAVTALFSLVCEEEFARVLKDGGLVVEVTAGTDHLIELKEIIYDEVFEQHKHPKPPAGFLREVCCEKKRFRLRLDSAQLTALLTMTPHTLRIRPEKRKALAATPSLTLTVEYFIHVMRK